MDALLGGYYMDFMLNRLSAILSTELGFLLELESGIARMLSVQKTLFHKSIITL